jgi:hypothetical protein
MLHLRTQVATLRLPSTSRSVRMPMSLLPSALDRIRKWTLRVLPLVFFTLAMPVAQAVDWELCGDMKSAAIMLESQKQDAVRVAKEYVCSDLLVANAPIGTWVACMTGQPTYLQPNPTTRAKEMEASYDKKIRSVISNIIRGGCVMD